MAKTVLPIIILDVKQKHQLDIPADYNTGIYIVNGEVDVGKKAKEK